MKTKTNHKTGWHKRVVNQSTNYPKDTHKEFCRRCLSYNLVCPATGSKRTSKACAL